MVAIFNLLFSYNTEPIKSHQFTLQFCCIFQLWYHKNRKIFLWSMHVGYYKLIMMRAIYRRVIVIYITSDVTFHFHYGSRKFMTFDVMNNFRSANIVKYYHNALMLNWIDVVFSKKKKYFGVYRACMPAKQLLIKANRNDGMV